MYDIADKLKQLRKDNKVSQDELADGILVSRQTISKWENGVVLPSLDNLQALCAFFKVEINYFFDENATCATARRKRVLQQFLRKKRIRAISAVQGRRKNIFV